MKKLLLLSCVLTVVAASSSQAEEPAKLDAKTYEQMVTKGIDATAFIRTPNGSIYYLSGGQKHPISSMTRYNQLSNGQPWLKAENPRFPNLIPVQELVIQGVMVALIRKFRN